MGTKTIGYDDPLYLELSDKFNKRTEKVCTPVAIKAIKNISSAIINDPAKYGRMGLYTVEMHMDGSLHKYDYFTGEYYAPLTQEEQINNT